MKTPRAESVIAADDMAFLDRLWEDWSPGYDAAEDLHRVKQCLREPDNLSAAIGYYRAEEPGLTATRRMRTQPSTPRCCGQPHSRRCTSTGIATAVSTSHSSPTPSATSPPALEWTSSKAPATFSTSNSPSR